MIAAHLLGMSWLVLLLSWVPGSVEAMTAVALLLGLEPAFVMVNHAIRLLLLYTMPALFKKQLERCVLRTVNKLSHKKPPRKAGFNHGCLY
ncbi:AbrB family transcriptional regulator [Vibrio metschnikovii]